MKLSGVMPPITTPFQDGKLALDKLKNNFQKWNKTGLSGYLVLGSNGEAVYLNEKEKMKVVEISRESIPTSKIMLVGTGMESTQETIQFTNQVAKMGADYALVVTPSYFKGSMKPQILYDHFIAVAESSRIGILIYNVPQFTGINLEPEVVAKLSEHPNIIGIKDSSGNIGQLSEIIHLSQKRICRLCRLGACILSCPLYRGGRWNPGCSKCSSSRMRPDSEPFQQRENG